jgi:transposase
MCLDPEFAFSVPEETRRVAEAAFPKGNRYMLMRDELGVLFEDPQFADLFPPQGQPGIAPWRLAMTTIFQFAEGLSDRQAADAVRSRIDWKFAQGLELTDPGFDASVLCEFRTRLLEGGAEKRLFELMLERFRERKWLGPGGRQRTDSTHILAAVHALNRLECVGETLRHALNSLAIVAPEWLSSHVRPEWKERYGRRFEDYRLPAGKDKRGALALVVGQDGWELLSALFSALAPGWLREVPAVSILRQVWLQQYVRQDEKLRWRTAEEMPPASLQIHSPYDIEARYGTKNTTYWLGYKAHVTETCEPDQPHLFTHVETSSALTPDASVTTPIHEALQQKQLLPDTHLVDTGYTDAELVARSQRDFGVDLLGPMRADYHWQARAGEGFDAASFAIDWDAKQVTCPEGHVSTKWSQAIDRRDTVIKVGFASRDCRDCPSRSRCTQSVGARRTITLRTRAHHEALVAARQRQQTEAFKAEYARRAGVEGTHSQGVRVCGLRRSRYIGMAKTHLQHLLTAAALNFVRVAEWLADTPLAVTRKSPFLKMMLAST